MGFFSSLLKGLKNVQQKNGIAQRSGTVDMDTMDGIMAIPVPTRKMNLTSSSRVTDQIEYKLQRKATEHKKNGRMDLAIACLRKSNEIMPYSCYSYSQKDYMRLVSFLRQDKQIEEAKKVEDDIKKRFPELFSEDVASAKAFIKIKKECDKLGTDLVEMSSHGATCSECAKYEGRVFSLTGKDSRFPVLPEQVKQYGGIHTGCRHTFHPFVYGVSTSLCGGKNIIAYSNRPFVDNRTEEQRKRYEEYLQYEANLKRTELASEEYKLIVEKLPDLAPKSLSAYSRMKNSKSASFQRIAEAASQKGIKIKHIEK